MRLPPAILLTTVGSVIHRTLPPHSSLSGGTLEAITEALPFLADTDLLAEGAAYNGMGVSFAGRDEMSETASLWRESLPRRLQSFECTDKVVLPPDQRGKISCRYRISFDATVPPAVLPGQRRRLDAAKLEYTPDGKTRVTALVAGSIQLDKDQKRIIRFSEVLVADPFAVTSSIAHFELLNARAVALATTPSIVREPLACASAGLDPSTSECLANRLAVASLLDC